MKVTVVGAGAVGASCAEYIAIKDFASEVVLLDIKEGFAEGKAMDLMQTASLNGFDTKITGTTSDYTKTANSDIAVITSGVPRKPGMTREELIGINAGIVRSVVGSLLEHSPNAILIVVSNPMDTMTYLTHKITDVPKHRIIGMGGALDSARFKYRLAEALNAPISDVDGMVIGGHSVIDKEPKYGLAVTGIIDPEQVKRKGGARPGDLLLLTKPLGVGIITTALKRGWTTAEDTAAAGAEIAVLRYRNADGHPFWLSRAMFTALGDLHGDKAVWKLLESGLFRAEYATVDEDVPLDVDTWEDYERLLASSGNAPA